MLSNQIRTKRPRARPDWSIETPASQQPWRILRIDNEPLASTGGERSSTVSDAGVCTAMEQVLAAISIDGGWTGATGTHKTIEIDTNVLRLP